MRPHRKKLPFKLSPDTHPQMLIFYCQHSTAVIKVQDKVGNYHMCRVLLDSGLQSNFITQSLVNKLQTEQLNLHIAVSGLNNSISQIKHNTNVRIMSNVNLFECTINCLIIPRITESLPASTFTKTSLKISENISLADPKFNESNEIDMLGSSIFWNLLRSGQIRLGKDKPIGTSKTVFGWVMAGEIPPSCVNYMQTQCYFISNAQIDNNLSKFWDIEEYANVKPQSPENEAIESYFKSTTLRDADGRFIVRLPLKLPVENLGPSRNIASKRLFAMETKLNNDNALKKQYVDFMTEDSNLNHMTKLQTVDNQQGYYIPHHFVKKESSLTTKLRVVFDTSSKTNTETNIRINQYKPIQTFELNTVTYGTASAPFLAVRCLQELAHENMKISPNASQIILDDFYVDDLLTGSDDLHELQQLQHISQILNAGCFTLNKWVSNNSHVLENISATQPNMILNIGKNNETHTLGLLWHSQSDTTSVNNSCPPECNVESKPKPKVTLKVTESNKESFDLFKKYSTLTKLQRVVATLTKLVQRETFTTEIKDLLKTSSVNVKSPLLKLNPYIDEDNVIRVGGRLNKSNFNFNKKHPIVLPKNYPFSMLSIRNEHTRLLHAGPQQVLALLRERFWILSARSLVNKVIHNCISCYKINPTGTYRVFNGRFTWCTR
ncbi:hypothetical protein NQ317_010248 [Molorchus minor]|uniref:Integrase zinc-binding domain-containing protein n=1 Tax=Molorchus minor TaxID=1323400 RepID=A0ABQ9JIW1_9CUCU|nr:hypothetical protein NQ317_010248 [Molorchus minor]